MTIPKMTSQDLNNILKDAQDAIVNIDSKVDKIKSDVSTKLTMINYNSEYMAQQINNVRDSGFTKEVGFKLLNKGVGSFESYGSTVHPVILRPSPIDLFNLKISNSQNILFRTDVSVKINDVAFDSYKSILKHDSMSDKEMFFKEFKEPINTTQTANKVKLEVSIDTKTLLGSTKFNMIEIDSFFPGSYDITSIDIYDIKEDGSLNLIPTSYSGALNVGKERLILKDKISFYKVIFNIELKFKTTKEGINTYPFGLKHIYFYEANFKQDSYVIMPLTSPHNIYFIKDETSILTPSGSIPTTLTEEGIKIYLNYKNEELTSEITPSTKNQFYSISKTIKTVYAKVPIKNKSIIGVSFILGSQTDTIEDI
jgi:hypothetical protein